MFVEFKRAEDSKIKVDVNKLIGYEPSGNRAYPAEEYTALIFGHTLLYVHEAFDDVDRKIMTAVAVSSID